MRSALFYCRYYGSDRDKLIPNTLFRMGASAAILTNKGSELKRCKYRLAHIIRTHMGADPTSSGNPPQQPPLSLLPFLYLAFSTRNLAQGCPDFLHTFCLECGSLHISFHILGDWLCRGSISLAPGWDSLFCPSNHLDCPSSRSQKAKLTNNERDPAVANKPVFRSRTSNLAVALAGASTRRRMGKATKG